MSECNMSSALEPTALREDTLIGIQQLRCCETNIAIIWKICAPMLLIIGTMGGLLNIIVLARKNNRNTSSGVFLIALTLTDLLVLYTALPREVIIHTFRIDIRDTNEFMCKSIFFILFFGLYESAWILVLITGERVTMVLLPHKAKILNTPRHAKLVLCVMSGVIVALNCHTLVGFGLKANKQGYMTCQPKWIIYDVFIVNILPWIDVFLFSLFPATFLVIGNVLIIIQTNRLKKRHEQRHKTKMLHGRRRSSIHAHWTSTFLLLVLLDAWFIICTFPICMFLVSEVFRFDKRSSERLNHDCYLWTFLLLLCYSNNTFNFFLYCLSGRKFMDQLKMMFCKREQIENRQGKNFNCNRICHSLCIKLTQEEQNAVALRKITEL